MCDCGYGRQYSKISFIFFFVLFLFFTLTTDLIEISQMFVTHRNTERSAYKVYMLLINMNGKINSAMSVCVMTVTIKPSKDCAQKNVNEQVTAAGGSQRNRLLGLEIQKKKKITKRDNFICVSCKHDPKLLFKALNLVFVLPKRPR